MKTNELDGKGFDAYSPYKSKCAGCIHFVRLEYACKAFPDGIPDKFLSGKETHNKVVDGQVGKFVLTT